MTIRMRVVGLLAAMALVVAGAASAGCGEENVNDAVDEAQQQ